MILQLGRFQQMGYDVADITYEDSISKMEAELDKLKYQQKFKLRIEFFHCLLWLFAWLVEKIADRIGYGSYLKDWSTHIHQQVNQFDEYYDEMIRPIYIHNSKGQVIRMENHSFISRASDSPELSLFVALVMSAVAYAMANNVHKFASLIGDDNTTTVSKKRKVKKYEDEPFKENEKFFKNISGDLDEEININDDNSSTIVNIDNKKKKPNLSFLKK